MKMTPILYKNDSNRLAIRENDNGYTGYICPLNAEWIAQADETIAFADWDTAWAYVKANGFEYYGMN